MLLGIYPTDLKAYNHTTTYTRMFVETLFTVAKNVEATNLCVSVGRWIKKKTVVHPDNGILFSTKKRNELSSHEKTWWKLKFILLSERSQSAKTVYCVFLETLETVTRSVVSRNWGEGRDE